MNQPLMQTKTSGFGNIIERKLRDKLVKRFLKSCASRNFIREKNGNFSSIKQKSTMVVMQLTKMKPNLRPTIIRK